MKHQKCHLTHNAIFVTSFILWKLISIQHFHFSMQNNYEMVFNSIHSILFLYFFFYFSPLHTNKSAFKRWQNHLSVARFRLCTNRFQVCGSKMQKQPKTTKEQVSSTGCRRLLRFGLFWLRLQTMFKYNIHLSTGNSNRVYIYITLRKCSHVKFTRRHFKMWFFWTWERIE